LYCAVFLLKASPQNSEVALIRAKDLVTGASHTCHTEYAIDIDEEWHIVFQYSETDI
jgi:plasmid maintenance system killer protein